MLGTSWDYNHSVDYFLFGWQSRTEGNESSNIGLKRFRRGRWRWKFWRKWKDSKAGRFRLVLQTDATKDHRKSWPLTAKIHLADLAIWAIFILELGRLDQGLWKSISLSCQRIKFTFLLWNARNYDQSCTKSQTGNRVLLSRLHAAITSRQQWASIIATRGWATSILRFPDRC